MSDEQELQDGESQEEDAKEKEEIGENQEKAEDDLSDDDRTELERLRKKEFNFKKLRGQTKSEKEEIRKGREELNKEWQEYKNSLIKERQEDALSLLVGDDEETRKKVLYNFNRIDPDKPATTKDEIFDRMREAAKLTGANAQPNILSQGGYSGYRNFDSKSESEASKEIRKELNITDEDKSKYSGEWKPKF